MYEIEEHIYYQNEIKYFHEIYEKNIFVFQQRGSALLFTSSEPLFEVGYYWTEVGTLVFSPSVSDFVSQFELIFDTWRKIVLNYENMLNESLFHPFTKLVTKINVW